MSFESLLCLKRENKEELEMSFTYHVCRALRLLRGKFRPYTSAVILAGGIGSRMGKDLPATKQMLLLGGIPVLARSAMAFEACEYIDEIVVVTRAEEKDAVLRMMQKYDIKKFSVAVEGGSTRCESALHGLEAISDKSKYVAIHDAVRCLITPAMISDVAAAAYANRAASAACVSVDTLKRVNGQGYVTETLNRKEIYRAQTPQIFDVNLYRAAIYSAKTDKTEFTDDNMLVEKIGHTIKIVNVGEENIKITTKLDLEIAKAILCMRQECES